MQNKRKKNGEKIMMERSRKNERKKETDKRKK